MYCGNYLVEDFPYRTAMFNSVQSSPTPAFCEANTITINWIGATAANIAANEAGTVTYGGNINTPLKAVQLPGRTFAGWTFSSTQPTNVQPDMSTYLNNGTLTSDGQAVKGNYATSTDTADENHTTVNGSNSQPLPSSLNQ